ncbi:MAG: sulfotransferase domain-containing protein [Porticoccus sp.]
MKKDYLIVAGTEKSGTTSIYQYLRVNPKIVGSSRKETDYFRSAPPHSLKAYEALFPEADPSLTFMEASPGYLSESNLAAPAIAALIPNAKIFFILRDPIDRILSSFEFHKSRFLIPADLSFDHYIDLCMSFDKGEIDAKEAGIDAWFLRVLDAGRYASHLRDYTAHFASSQIKVLTLDRLQHDPRGFMCDVCKWAELDSKLYSDFGFIRANVTFTPRFAWLQHLGLWVNDSLEPFFNRHPVIKRKLLSAYKKANLQDTTKTSVSPNSRRLLIDYYSSDVEQLRACFGEDVAEAGNWLKKYHKLNARGG